MVDYKSGELLLNFVIKCLILIQCIHCLLQFLLSIRYFQSLVKATAMLNNFLHLLPAYRAAQELQFMVLYMSIGQHIRKLYPLALALFYALKTKCSTSGMEQALCSPYTTLLYHLLLCDFFQKVKCGSFHSV